MLVSLNIRNYALIDNLSIEFKKGLNVLTGETGAGKSIIIGALSLAMGERASVEAVRSGEKKITVQALFELDVIKEELSALFDEYGIEAEDGSILITRDVTDSGKNVCRVNDTLVSVAALKNISSELVDIHGQHEHQKLLNPNTHIDFIDMFGKTHTQPLKDELRESFRLLNERKKELDSMVKNAQTEKERLDEYKRAYEEIISAKLQPGEDEELEGKLKIMSNSEKLYELMDSAYSAMYRSENSVADILYTSQNEIISATKIDPSLLSIADGIEQAAITIEDILLQIRDYKDSLEYDPGQLDYIQERLEKISVLKRKYGSDITAVISYADELLKKIENITNYDFELGELEKAYESACQSYDENAMKLSEIREILAKRFASELTSNLNMLSMPNAVFIVDLVRDTKNRSANGIDTIQFMFTSNPGQEPKPLAKIASGGEISRVMLAAKAILADADATDTMIFDEIDTGISGRTAQTVAEKMCDIAKSHQVIAITHLPQISSMADAHFLVSKEAKEGETFTHFTYLNEAQRYRELARMLGGVSVTETTLKHAEEMLKQAEDYKKRFISQ